MANHIYPIIEARHLEGLEVFQAYIMCCHDDFASVHANALVFAGSVVEENYGKPMWLGLWVGSEPDFTRIEHMVARFAHDVVLNHKLFTRSGTSSSITYYGNESSHPLSDFILSEPDTLPEKAEIVNCENVGLNYVPPPAPKRPNPKDSLMRLNSERSHYIAKRAAATFVVPFDVDYNEELYEIIMDYTTDIRRLKCFHCM